MVGLSVATLSTNLAANVVSPANDFSNLSPHRISARAGGVITAVIGAVILPWKLIESSKGYIFTWLVGYSALLGPIGGIMIADYFLLRRTQLEVDDLYRRGGAYEYQGGVNWRAMAALSIGVLINLPGFLAEAIPSMKDAVPGVMRSIYTYAWFVGFFVSGGLYLLFSLAGPAETAAARAARGASPAR
jgi:NCS1 family nucleobase:cation symporter-1